MATFKRRRPWWWSSCQRARLIANDRSLNPADAYSFYVKFAFEKNENETKEAGIDPFKNI